MENNKKFLPVIKVGGRRVVKKPNTTRENIDKLKKLIEENKKIFTKSSIDDLVLERGSKYFKYKSNIRIVLDSSKRPVGIFLSGIPEVKNKLVFDVPEDFEAVVDVLNKQECQTKLEKALNID